MKLAFGASLLGLLSAFLFFFTGGCYSGRKVEVPSGSFRVQFAPGTKVGSPDKPLPVPRNFLKLSLIVEPLDKSGNYDSSYKGKVCFFSDKGLLKSSFFPIEIAGKTEVTVQIRLAFGKTGVWVSEVSGDRCPNSLDPDDTVLTSVGRVGAAPPLYFDLLSIRDVQMNDQKPYSSPLYKKYAVIGKGKMVVTGVTSNGFYLTDLSAYRDGLGFDSIFIFTFSAPTIAFGEGPVPRTLQIGEVVERVEGGVDEFSGHTQLTFPTFVPKWKGKRGGEIERVSENELPKPRAIGAELTWNRREMEPFESALVEVKNALPIEVVEAQDGWKEFRQWPVLLVEAKSSDRQKRCEGLVKRELGLTSQKGEYRSCLDKCRQERLKLESKCSVSDEKCLSKARDSWYRCYFDCRCSTKSPTCSAKGLIPRLEKEGCSYGIILVITSETFPSYDPLSAQHLKRRFTRIRGILKQVKAAAFYKIIPDQYPDEMSNGGFVIWVRGKDDLAWRQSN